MKITKEIWYLGELKRIKEFNSISDAVEDASTSDKRLAELVGRLVEAAFNDEYQDKRKALSYVLGSDYEVSDDS